MSFIFGGNTNETPESIARKRAMAEALMSRATSRVPQNVGEGINAVGQALAGVVRERRADRQESEGRASGQEAFAPIVAALSGGAQTPSMPGAMPATQGQSSALPASLVRTESGGNFGASNNVPGSGGVGHFGRGQFSRGRLQDAINAGVIPQGTTPEAFMADPAMQQSVEQWHVGDINGFIEQNGLDRFVGQEINGTPVTPNGMLAVAHLGGQGGLQRFLETGGQYNPADANGTSLMDYLATHGQAGQEASPAVQRVAQAMPQRGQGLSMGQIMQAAENPWLTEGQRSVLNSLMQQRMQAQDPMRQMEMERAQIELDRLRNPQADPMTPLQQLQLQRAEVGLERDRLALEEARNPPEPEPDEMTESERRIFLFNNIQTQTGPVIDQLETTTFDPASMRDRFGSTVIGGNFFREPEGRQYEAAASAWSEGALRIATGAAATPEEVERIRNTYFAQVGDDPETVEFKRQMRASYQEVLRATMAGDPNAQMPNPLMDFLSRPEPDAGGSDPSIDDLLRQYGGQ